MTDQCDGTSAQVVGKGLEEIRELGVEQTGGDDGDELGEEAAEGDEGQERVGSAGLDGPGGQADLVGQVVGVFDEAAGDAL